MPVFPMRDSHKYFEEEWRVPVSEKIIFRRMLRLFLQCCLLYIPQELNLQQVFKNVFLTIKIIATAFEGTIIVRTKLETENYIPIEEI
jgi:hypothetical protein